ncbi:STE3-domain-containing protein [Mycena indigotica]|uniref:STE3-domain-containing protein n=1 Tax=Mycena indigotica TaxID=2126181 RepID=A0A8H6SCP8_9AGAR|nr:STE3-domain-containing protein [Mycena indigotica]KAF7297004.1 STE3-domain-containing protein [Mycena indigotica]
MCPLLCIMSWFAVSDLIYFADALLWSGNVDIKALIWCDITTKLKIGGEIALPAAAVPLSVKVYRITLQKRPMGLLFDLGVCVALPAVIMALHTIVQGNRFDIIEVIGCSPNIYVSIPSIIILDIPPLVCSILTLIFCGISLVNFTRQRRAFHLLTRGPKSDGRNRAQYIRLMALTTVLGVWSTIVVALTRSSEYHSGLLPWISWAEVHADFWSFERAQYMLSLIPQATLGPLMFSWASIPISSLITFAFFGVGSEAVTKYRALFIAIKMRAGMGDGGDPVTGRQLQREAVSSQRKSAEVC